MWNKILEMKEKYVNKKEIISVIVPVYNVEEFLPRCLDSIINNTFPNLEIICIDDGSTDGSLEILHSYREKDKRIKVYSKNNGGLSSARNEGIKHCTGDWIAFVDSDDWLHKEYFSTLLTIQNSKNYDIVAGDFLRTTDLDSMDYRIDNYWIKELDSVSYFSSRETKIYVWGRIYRRNLVENILFDENEKIEDVIYNMEVALRNPELKAAYVNLKIYAYYMRENSLVSFVNRFDIFKLAEKIYRSTCDIKDCRMKDTLYEESLKRCLVVRYDFQLHREKKCVRQSDLLAKKCLRQLPNIRMRFLIMVYMPLIYRIYRIITDPTMLKYEIKVKQLMK